jgi:hypothetical protein
MKTLFKQSPKVVFAKDILPAGDGTIGFQNPRKKPIESMVSAIDRFVNWQNKSKLENTLYALLATADDGGICTKLNPQRPNIIESILAGFGHFGGMGL